jgi:adenylate cyclase
LAEALERLAAMGPRAIGVDLYRDRERPPGGEKLEATLKRHDNIYAVFKFAEGAMSGIPPPAVLRGSERVGFADTLSDPGGIVRRGLLYLDDGKDFATSIALRLALAYLAPAGVAAAGDEEGNLRLGSVSLPPFGADDGGYVGADAHGYQILLDYRGGHHPFPILSLSQLLDGKVQPEAVRDKVVLLGVAAESVHDYFYSPYSHGIGVDRILYGFELHGHLVDQLLRHALDGVRPIFAPGQWAEASWVWLWCMVGAVLGARVKALTWLAGSGLAGLTILGAAWYGAGMAGLWTPLAAPVVGMFVSGTAVTMLMRKQERALRGLLMRIFSSNVSTEIAEKLWQERDAFLEGGRPRSQRMVASVIFTDLRSFTTLSEGMAPEELMGWLNGYMDRMSQIVIDHGGVIDKYIGDAIMAVFGVPFARESEAEIAADAERAVDCALAMAATLDRMNQEWREEGRPTIAMRVGIFTGPVVAGPLGSAQRMNYTVLGDTVNTAQRLEAYDKTVAAEYDCRILIGEPTARRLRNRYVFVPVGAVSLKGKTEKVNVLLVTGRRPLGDEGRAPAAMEGTR